MLDRCANTLSWIRVVRLQSAEGALKYCIGNADFMKREIMQDFCADSVGRSRKFSHRIGLNKH